MVQMKQVDRVRTGPCEHLDPGSDQPFVSGIVDGRKDAIGRIRAILVGRRKGNRRRQRIRTLQPGRVVHRPHVDPAKKLAA
jgi:hypothetical protein